jgi:hypothetical protein
MGAPGEVKFEEWMSKQVFDKPATKPLLEQVISISGADAGKLVQPTGPGVVTSETAEPKGITSALDALKLDGKATEHQGAEVKS